MAAAGKGQQNVAMLNRITELTGRGGKKQRQRI
jgi:hypothetical protein